MRDEKLKKVQPESTKHALRRTIVACLTGTLLLMLAMVVAPTPSYARVSVGVYVGFGPPALPVYVQPPCPAPGYIWTPGYWAWDPAYGYYWVPGTWVPAPFVGALWTPGYWGFYDGGYRWHRGYWGYSVGFYGGINYGFGYTGYGYHGGYWNHNRFYYNRYVNRIEGRNFRHVYNRRVEDRFRDRRVSYNGGPGGMHARATRRELAAERGRHFGPSSQQLRQERFARRDPSQRARRNHGRPGVAATRRAGEFRGHGAVRATRAGAPYRAPVERTHGGRQNERHAPARANNNGGFRSFGSPHNGQANHRRESRTPIERANQRPTYRNSQSHQREMRQVERRPAQRGPERQVRRNDPPRNYQRAQQRSQPQQMRRVESHPAPQQHANFSRQEARGGGNSHGGGEHGHGHGGRGGRH